MSVHHHLPIVGVVIDGLDTYVWENQRLVANEPVKFEK